MGELIFNPSAWEAETVDLCDSETSLVYTARSRTATATSCDLVSTRMKVMQSRGKLYTIGKAGATMKIRSEKTYFVLDQ